ncbi:MAG: hypothetical protein WA539_10375, partial [Candidatus Sulfotelmatobacter sp.]
YIVKELANQFGCKNSSAIASELVNLANNGLHSCEGIVAKVATPNLADHRWQTATMFVPVIPTPSDLTQQRHSVLPSPSPPASGTILYVDDELLFTRNPQVAIM